MIKVQGYEVDATLPRDLFDIQQLRSDYPEASPAVNESGDSESASEVQQAIEEFGKMFE